MRTFLFFLVFVFATTSVFAGVLEDIEAENISRIRAVENPNLIKTLKVPETGFTYTNDSIEPGPPGRYDLKKISFSELNRKRIFSWIGWSDFLTLKACESIVEHKWLQQQCILPYLYEVAGYILNSDWSDYLEEYSLIVNPYKGKLIYTRIEVGELAGAVFEAIYTIDQKGIDKLEPLMIKFIRKFPDWDSIYAMDLMGEFGTYNSVEPILQSAVEIQRPCEEERKLPLDQRSISCTELDWQSAFGWSWNVGKIFHRIGRPTEKTLRKWMKGDEIESSIRRSEIELALSDSREE